MIKIRNLTKSYRVKGGRHYVFKNVNAEFPEGANIGIIGPNGGGKSTFLSILGGIDFPDNGEIITDRSFSWPLGLKGGFVGHLSGRENCRMVCNLYGLGRNDTAQKLEKMKSLAGIGDYFDEPVKYYSSGMGSRLGFALSMSFDFDYFLIDEITSVGDAHFKALARQAFQEKARKSRMIMVSHNMGDIKKFCDIVVLVKNGQLEVFEDMDAAIRAYLPQTQESTEDTAEIMSEASLEEIDLSNIQLPTDYEAMVPEIAERLESIEIKLTTPEHQITRTEDEFFFQLAFAYQSLGNEPRAFHFYKKSAEANSCHLEAQQRLAALAAARGLHAEEQQALAAAERVDPLNIITLDAKVRYLIRLGELDKALEVTLAALRVDPHHVGFWSQRAGIFLALGETSKAVEAQIKAVKHGPDRSQSYLRLATILACGGDIKLSALARHRARIAAENTVHKLKMPSFKNIIKSLRKLDDDLRV